LGFFYLGSVGREVYPDAQQSGSPSGITRQKENEKEKQKELLQILILFFMEIFF
jgi:hypothetical protein